MSRLQRARDEQKILDEHSDSSRWIVSYADFITLLFAFFVVMYSISSVNDGKFRVLSHALVTEFNEPSHRPVPIDLGGTQAPPETPSAELLNEVALDEDATFDLDVEPLDIDARASISERVAAAMDPLVKDTDVVVRDGQQWLQVELPSELLFASGQADLNRHAEPVLNRMARALYGVATPIRVEGFTDNVPINGGRFSSNWQLSAARAAAVVNQFASGGIDPKLLSAIGFGEFHPIAENDSDQGRTKNRRVVVAIAKHDSVGLGGPVASATQRVESVPTRTLQRVTRLPGALGVL